MSGSPSLPIPLSISKGESWGGAEAWVRGTSWASQTDHNIIIFLSLSTTGRLINVTEVSTEAKHTIKHGHFTPWLNFMIFFCNEGFKNGLYLTIHYDYIHLDLLHYDKLYKIIYCREKGMQIKIHVVNGWLNNFKPPWLFISKLIGRKESFCALISLQTDFLNFM